MTQMPGNYVTPMNTPMMQGNYANPMMMGNNQIATQPHSLTDDRFSHIRRQQYFFYLCIAITYLQPRIIPLLLPAQGRYRFYDINYILK